MILATQSFGDEPVGAQLDLPNFFKNFAGDHASEKLRIAIAEFKE